MLRRDREEARLAALHAALERVRAACDVPRRLAADPVSVVHRYDDPLDREIVALVASSLAFGNVKAFRAKIDDALDRIGPDVARACDDPARVARALRGWRHRVYDGEVLAKLVVGARAVQREHGSLGAALARDLDAPHGELRGALAAWTTRIRRAGGLDAKQKPKRSGAAPKAGAAHILADPLKGSAAKRLLLLLRWMCRPADGIDLGAWPIDPARLLVPVDTHIHRLGNNLGLTRRRDLSWRTAEEITRALARFDPTDPVKYDFSLCHLGMLQHCPSRRDEARCHGCGIQSVCRHWQRGGASQL
ncbi:MAG TPA: DUF2400 domain-containing protein [Minicystis sp.]|nr:DUF2400 domain-containing protein [Minicystis sp.]